MAFLTTQTEEMLAAEQLLSGINTNLAAQNAGAAAATTVIAPAAADPVSAQQAAIFSAYGTQYQAIATEAQALLENYAQTLGISSGSYGDTEAINASQAALSSAASPAAAAAATPSNTPLDWLAYLLGSTGNGTNPNMLGGIFGLSSNGANIGNIGFGNWASAGSDLLGLAGGGLLDTSAADAAGSAAGAAGLADTTAPMAGGGMAGIGAAPMASMGSATMVSKLSVPPSWAAPATPVVGTSAAPLQTVGWTAAAPQAGAGTIIPGMPGMGAAARNSAGFGAPRYGVKPIVMPKPATV
ncbi:MULTISPECIES: PE domain-containing protein [unclassified Mycobacterium]|uniref:PPE family protein, SVP subgroup n=1 Tax=unclassified Mycobacterium TaxID=2642494 RepID=UPI0007FDB5CF|nr:MULTISPECIES: PE domain-containing protein [unclassified Mycobacterium]OBG54522.1 PE family protein [Mycobacterium sp. E188]OBG56554.1 PE family protein [Mycobacterium sp. E735]OBG71491.1 PE family protein [Mycobacterium sp. E3298]OBH13100.1 PE family protein [Mycobacterium sp. E1715]